jgi:TolB-like protein/class 3 adenylate cyclase
VPVHPVERKLAAIFAADIAGYSRLMGRDEVGTLVRLKACRAIVDGLIASHRGRIFNTAGDSVVADFASAVDAVQCAVAVQAAITTENAGGGADELMQFRIGVHVGDVMVDGDNLLGDGVNIAARLEAFAGPGAICVSAVVRDQVGNKLPLGFDDLGDQQVKNIAQPIRVYRVQTVTPAPLPAVAALALPDKPSIAVLPFQNMSGDPEQEYFADGMVEEIITALSRIRWLFVIARNSSFTYKGQSVDVKQIGRELGVRYVLEGSVRKGGNRVRITAQLIEIGSAAHLWADRFDGTLEDVFELQDKVAISVAGVIEPTLRKAEIHRAGRKPTGNLDAHDLYLRALAESEKGESGLREAVKLLEAALAIDPSYAIAAARIAHCRMYLQSHGFHVSDNEMAEAGQLAVQAIRLGNDDPEALWMGAHGAAYFSRAYGVAESASERALALNPNSASAWTARGWVLALRHRPEPAIEAFQRAMRLSPLDPESYYFASGIAFAKFYMGRFEEAVEWADRSLDMEPRFVPVLRFKTVACVQLGRIEEARRCLRQVLELQPELTIARLKNYPAMSVTPEILVLFEDAFRKAGLPE